MKKGILMMLALLLITTTAALAQPTPATQNSGLEAYIDISPDTMNLLADQSVVFTAAADLEQRGNDEAEFVSAGWSAQNVIDPNNALPLTLSVLTSPETGEDSEVFVSTASLAPLSVPGVYVVRVTFTLTVDPRQGNLDNQEFTATEDFTLTVLGPDATLPPDDGGEGDDDGFLNHGQIVSAWAQWKQTRERDGFARGGPDVERSKVWYKTQVEYMEFASQEEVWEYLDSIYMPYEGGDDGMTDDDNGNGRDKDDNGNGNGKDKDDNGNNGNGKDNKGN